MSKLIKIHIEKSIELSNDLIEEFATLEKIPF